MRDVASSGVAVLWPKPMLNGPSPLVEVIIVLMLWSELMNIGESPYELAIETVDCR